MSANSGNAPAWLFSFLDLAFLILIALLYTSDGVEKPAAELASIELPEIQQSSTVALEVARGVQWQLRVHPRLLPEDASTFSLVAHEPGGVRPEPNAARRVSPQELKLALEGLRARASAKPLLAPHRDSRSEDFLTALGFLQQIWPELHAAAVRPRPPLPAVSAAALSAERFSPATLPRAPAAQRAELP